MPITSRPAPISTSSMGINLRPCNDVQQAQNLANIVNGLGQLQQQIGNLQNITNPPSINNDFQSLSEAIQNLNTQLSQFFGGTGGGASYKVKVNASDTPDYLEGQMKDWQNTPDYVSSEDLLVQVDTVVTAGDPQLRYYGDMSTVSGWSNVGKQALITDTGTLKFIAKTTLTPIALTPNTLSPTTVTPTTVTPTSTTVVTDVSWDTGTCVMTKTTGTIYTFPSSSAINVFPSSSAVNVFPSSSNVFVFPNGSANYVFPNSNPVNYFQG